MNSIKINKKSWFSISLAFMNDLTGLRLWMESCKVSETLYDTRGGFNNRNIRLILSSEKGFSLIQSMWYKIARKHSFSIPNNQKIWSRASMSAQDWCLKPQPMIQLYHMWHVTCDGLQTWFWFWIRRSTKSARDHNTHLHKYGKCKFARCNIIGSCDNVAYFSCILFMKETKGKEAE